MTQAAPSSASPFSIGPDGLRVAVRLVPGASRTAIDGVIADSDGATALKASVTEIAEGGRANAALVKLLAKEWRLPRTAIGIIRGATDRRKLLAIDGDARQLQPRLEEWMARFRP